MKKLLFLIAGITVISYIANAQSLEPKLKKSVEVKTADATFEDGYADGYERRTVYLDAGNTLPSYPNFQSYLADLYSYIYKDVPVDKTVEAFLMQPKGYDEPNQPVTVCKIPEDAHMGVSEQDVTIYQACANNRLVEFNVFQGYDTGSGTGAGISCSEEHPIYLKTPTKWCPDGIVKFDMMFKTTPAALKGILALLKLKVCALSKDADACFQSHPERVPKTVLLDKTGVNFIFPKYEIACGAAGNVYLHITYTKLRPYMKPVFYNFITSCTGWKYGSEPSDMYD